MKKCPSELQLEAFIRESGAGAAESKPGSGPSEPGGSGVFSPGGVGFGDSVSNVLISDYQRSELRHHRRLEFDVLACDLLNQSSACARAEHHGWKQLVVREHPPREPSRVADGLRLR